MTSSKNPSRDSGFTLMECLVVVAVLGILATTAIANPVSNRHRLELQRGLRRIRVGLDRGRMAAQRHNHPCGLTLTAEGWQSPSSDALPPCASAGMTVAEVGPSSLQLRSNLPDLVRFSANGLVLDGGLVVLRHPRLQQPLCLVIGLPLGITRTGVYRTSAEVRLSSALCQPQDHA
ncbi:MAG: prepilin-type N-terminal cleavage/methylation domain-containing protein [Cyanobacteriota bacterium]|nr:prepilin-type N-terminal cleavage/methylation domain-containing protein [Cyanobacteriota bacterium]